MMQNYVRNNYANYFQIKVMVADATIEYVDSVTESITIQSSYVCMYVSMM